MEDWMFQRSARVPVDPFFNRLHKLGWTGLYDHAKRQLVGYIPPGGNEAVPLRALLAIPQASQLTTSGRFWMWVWSWA